MTNMLPIDRLAKDDGFIYIGTRLFDYIEKYQTELLEEKIKQAIFPLFKKCGVLTPSLRKITFVPFRDTDEHLLSGKDRTRIIYEKDIDRLNSKKLIAFISIFNDICKDEGIAFEIGYLYTKGIPVFVLNTDFIWYSLKENPSIHFQLDPVLENLIYEFIHYYKIPSRVDLDFKASLLLGLDNASLTKNYNTIQLV